MCLSNFFVSFYNDIYKQNNTKTIKNKTKPKQTKTKTKIKTEKQIKKNKETKDKHSLRNKKKHEQHFKIITENEVSSTK